MERDYPTDEDLKRIEEWPWQDFEALANFVVDRWHFDDWAVFRELTKDEYGDEYRELRLATAGWSGNESIIAALSKNRMWDLMCWQSSHRGGLHIYHVRKFPETTN